MKRRNLWILVISAIIIIAVIFASFIFMIERKKSDSVGVEAPDLGDFFDYSEYDFLRNFDIAEMEGETGYGDVGIRDFILGGEWRGCLYFSPDGGDDEGVGVIYRGLRIGEESHLTFDLGIGPMDGGTEIAQRSGRFTFQIFVVDGDEREEVFKEVLRLKSKDDLDRLLDFNVNLSKFSGKVVDIEFAAKSNLKDADNCILLSHPLLNTLPYNADWPNIIFISIDTLRADHLGLNGYFRETSPNIDEFAKDGVRYKRCISQAPFTLTSYASMFTGLYPNRNVAMKKLDDIYITWAKILKELGYETASYNGGGYVSKRIGIGQGFDTYEEYPGSAASENDIVWEIENATKYLKEWNARGKKKKLFMFIHTYEVHSWYKPPVEYKKAFLRGDGYFHSSNNFLIMGDIKEYLGGDGWGEKGENRYREIPAEDREIFIDLYDAEIYYTDVWLGRLFDFLKSEGIYDDALIILNSDHGEEFYEHGGWCHSHQLYGELINVPLIIKYPKGEIKGVEDGRVARSIDILPTVLHDVMGIDISKFDFDGVPLSRPIEDAKTLSFNFNGMNLARIAVYKGGYKFIVNYRKYAGAEPDRPESEIYCFTGDPLDKDRVEKIGEDDIDYFNYVSETEKALFDLNRNRMLERESGLDLDPAMDEETVEKLKDLGYLQ